MSREKAMRTALIATAQAMNASGINVGTAGNLSVRSGDEMLITPSGVPYGTLVPDDIVAMSADTTWRATGERRPSSEWRFHLDVLAARPDIEAVVHAHPPNATALAVHGKGIGPFHYMVGVAGGHYIRCAPYATFGTQELSDHVVAALEGRKAALMAHHGIIAVGPSLSAALAVAVEVEQLAAIYLAALAIGEPAELSTAQMEEVLEKMASPDGYGSAPVGTRTIDSTTTESARAT